MIYFREVGGFFHAAGLLCRVFIAVHDGDVLQHVMHVGDVWTQPVIAQRLLGCFVGVSIKSIHTVVYARVVQIKLVKSQ